MDLDEFISMSDGDFETVTNLLISNYKKIPDFIQKYIITRLQKAAFSTEDVEFYNQGKNCYESINYNCSKVPNPFTSHVAIWGFHHPLVGEWDPESVKAGISGSEEAIIHMANLLAQEDPKRQVIVLGSPPKNSFWSFPLSNPRYVKANLFDSNTVQDKTSVKRGESIPTKFKFIICWRRMDFSTAKKYADKVYFWPHDIAHGAEPPMDGLDGVFYLSNWHKKDSELLFKSISKYPSVISGNGVRLEDFDFIEKDDLSFVKENPYSCVYASNYSRGLELLIDIWPIIREKYPQATLDIAYGRQVYNTMTQANLNTLIEKIDKLKDKGVNELGKLSHKELIEVFKRNSIWAYPYQGKSETFCITAIKAQLCGAIPVVIKKHALEEVVCESAPHIIDQNPDADKARYKKLLLEVMKNIDSYDRSKFHNFAKTYTWGRVLQQWKTIMK